MRISFWRYILFLCLENISLVLYFHWLYIGICALDIKVTFPVFTDWTSTGEKTSPISLAQRFWLSLHLSCLSKIVFFVFRCPKYLKYPRSHQLFKMSEIETNSSSNTQKNWIIKCLIQLFPLPQGETGMWWVFCFVFYLFVLQ